MTRWQLPEETKKILAQVRTTLDDQLKEHRSSYDKPINEALRGLLHRRRESGKASYKIDYDTLPSYRYTEALEKIGPLLRKKEEILQVVNCKVERVVPGADDLYTYHVSCAQYPQLVELTSRTHSYGDVRAELELGVPIIYVVKRLPAPVTSPIMTTTSKYLSRLPNPNEPAKILT